MIFHIIFQFSRLDSAEVVKGTGSDALAPRCTEGEDCPLTRWSRRRAPLCRDGHANLVGRCFWMGWTSLALKTLRRGLCGPRTCYGARIQLCSGGERVEGACMYLRCLSCFCATIHPDCVECCVVRSRVCVRLRVPRGLCGAAASIIADEFSSCIRAKPMLIMNSKCYQLLIHGREMESSQIAVRDCESIEIAIRTGRRLMVIVWPTSCSVMYAHAALWAPSSTGKHRHSKNSMYVPERIHACTAFQFTCT